MRLYKVFYTVIISALIFLISSCSNGTATSTTNNTPPITLPPGQVGLAGFQTLSVDSDEVDDRVSANMYLTVTANQNYANFLISLPASGEFRYGNGSFIVESPVWTGSSTGACLTASYKGIRRDLSDINPLTTYKQEVGTLAFSDCNLNTSSDLMSATLIMTNSNNDKFKYILAGFAFPSFDFMAVDANQSLYTQTTAPVLLVRGLMGFKEQGDLVPLEFLSDIPFANKDSLSKLITLLQQQPDEVLFTSPISGQSDTFGTLSGNVSFNLITNLENFTAQFKDLSATIILESFPTPSSGGLSYLRNKPAVSSESAAISATGEGGGAFNNIFNPNGQVNANYIITLGVDAKEQASAVKKQSTDLTLLSMYASMMPNYKESFAISYTGYTESAGKLYIYNPSNKAHLVLDMITPYPNFSTFYTVTIKLSAGLTATESDIIPQNSDIKCSISTNNSIVCQFFQNANGRGTKVDMYLSQVVPQEGFTYTVNMTSAQQATLINSQTRIRFVTPDNPTPTPPTPTGGEYIYALSAESVTACKIDETSHNLKECKYVTPSGSGAFTDFEGITANQNKSMLYISDIGLYHFWNCPINADGSLGACTDVSYPTQPTNLTLDTSTNRLYTVAFGSGYSYEMTFREIGSDGIIEGTSTTAKTPGDSGSMLAFNNDGTKVYYTVPSTDFIYKCTVDNPAGTFSGCAKTATSNTFSSPRGITINGSRAYIANATSSKISKCDIVLDELSDCVDTGSAFAGPSTIVFTLDNSHAYISNTTDNTITKCNVLSIDGHLDNCSDAGATSIATPLQALTIFKSN